jgi:hypothetical protein
MTFVLRRRELIRQTSRQSSPSLTDRTGPGSSLRLLARTLFPVMRPASRQFSRYSITGAKPASASCR